MEFTTDHQPLDETERDAARLVREVANDLRAGRVSADEAREVYGELRAIFPRWELIKFRALAA